MINFAFLASMVISQPNVDAPVEVRGAVGRAVAININTDATAIRWINVDDKSTDLIAFPDGRKAIFVSPTAGNFRVFVVAASSNSLSEPIAITVVVGDGPTPIDPLVQKFQQLFDEDKRNGKGSGLQNLTEFYRQSALVVERCANLTELNAKQRDLVRLINADTLLALRAEINRINNETIPRSPDVLLTQELKQKITQHYNTIARALEKLK